MQDRDDRQQAGASSGRCDVAVVGHVGLAATRTADGADSSLGGSGYAAAASAAALIGRRVGLVAQIGQDLDRALLQRLDINTDGVMQLPGRSPQLHIEEFRDGTRSFSSNLGTAARVRLDAFPDSYLRVGHIHLGTMPPWQQLEWLGFLRGKGCIARISADMFEHFVATDPKASRAVCDDADLIFMNEAEYRGLYAHGDSGPKSPLILKRGSAGARLLRDGMSQDVPASPARPVDPTGGGEILAGVFLALCAEGLPDLGALTYAVRAAARCVEDFGVRGPRLIAYLADLREEVVHRGA
ncbi:MAG: carbohydrate kinase family protein [Actinomycetota bacterium]|nr:carbohydrate kinase family protein [Actinomycetota bacterium]